MSKRSPLYYWRKLHSVTVQDLSEELGIHRVTVHKLETYRLAPGRELATAIGDLLGRSADDVLRDYDSHMRREEVAR